MNITTVASTMEKVNKTISRFFDSSFYKNFLTKKSIFIVGGIGVVLISALMAIQIQRYMIKQHIAKTHNMFHAYIQKLNTVEEELQDIKDLESSFTVKTTTRRLKDEIKEYNAAVSELDKAHVTLQKQVAKAPSKDSRTYYEDIKEFDTMAVTEYKEGTKLFASLEKFMNFAVAMESKDWDAFTDEEAMESEDFLEAYKSMMSTMSAVTKEVQKELVVIKDDAYFSEMYIVLDDYFGTLNLAINEMLDALEKEEYDRIEAIIAKYDKELPDLETIDTYAFDKHYDRSKKRTQKINTTYKSIMTQDEELLKKYQLEVDEEIQPTFRKGEFFTDDNMPFTDDIEDGLIEDKVF